VLARTRHTRRVAAREGRARGAATVRAPSRAHAGWSSAVVDAMDATGARTAVVPLLPRLERPDERLAGVVAACGRHVERKAVMV